MSVMSVISVCLFICHRLRDNAFLPPNCPQALDDKGFVRVNRHLQMEGFGNVFVGGDVAAINEEKLAQSAGMHVCE